MKALKIIGLKSVRSSGVCDPCHLNEPTRHANGRCCSSSYGSKEKPHPVHSAASMGRGSLCARVPPSPRFIAPPFHSCHARVTNRQRRRLLR